MKIAKRPDAERLHILAATLRVWLLDVLVWLSEWCGNRLPRDLRIELRREMARAERDVRMLVVLLAVARMDIPVVDHTPTTRPCNMPRGYRRARGLCPEGRAFTRGVRLGGLSIRARLMRLHAVFETLGAVARRMVRHLQPRRGGAALVMVTAAASPVRDVAGVALECADTS